MKMTLNPLVLSLGFATVLQAATLTWDGGADSNVSSAFNWSPNVSPSGSYDLLINTNTNLRDGWILDWDTTTGFLSLNIDPQWSGGNFGIQGSGVIDLYGDLVISSNYTDDSEPFCEAKSLGNLGIRSRGNHGFINNGSATVWFQGEDGGSNSEINFVGLSSGAQTIQFGGSGDFLLGNNLQVGSTLERIWTTDDFSGTLTISNAGNDADDESWLDPGIDFRLQGGTAVIAADEQIGDSTSIAINDTDHGGVTLKVTGITEAAAHLALFGSGTGSYTLNVDEFTSLTFHDFRQNNYSGNPLNIVGWSEGNTSILFTDLGNQFYEGLIDDYAPIQGLTINSGPAYMVSVPGGWKVTSYGSAPVARAFDHLGPAATHVSWTRSGGNADSPWTMLIQPFNGSTLSNTVTTGSGLELTDNVNGSYRIRAKKNQSAFDCTMQGAAYGFNPADYPFLRFRLTTPEANTMVFGPLNDWEHATYPTSSNSLSYAQMNSFDEVYGRFANVPSHIQQEVAQGQNRYTEDGFRFDLVSDTVSYERDFDLDYIAVDTHPCRAIAEFDLTALDGSWTVSNLVNVGVADGAVTGQVSGAASLSIPLSADGEYWNMLEMRLARDTGATNGFAFAWRSVSNIWSHAEIDPVADDGQFHYYQIDLAKCPEWFGEPVAEIKLYPYSDDAANNGLGFKLDYLRLRHMPVVGGSSMEWGDNLNSETHLYRWNTGNALMRYFGTSLAIWNNPGGELLTRTSFARLANERGLRLTCTIQSAKFLEGPADYDSDGKDEYRIPQTNGVPDPQLCAELAFAHIRQLGVDMQAVGFDKVYIGFDGLMRYLMFPTYRLDQDDTSGGFYEAAGNQINQQVWDNCADTLIRLMQMCHTNSYTTNFRFRVYPNFHMWEWDGQPRDLTRDIVSVGDFIPVIDAIHAANTNAFPDGDSPLTIFDADYPEDYVTWGNKCRKLVRYQDYIQNLGYLAMCNAIDDGVGVSGGLSDRMLAHTATTNFIAMVTKYGGRPDIVNCGWWKNHWKGSFFEAAVDEEDTAEYTLTSLWLKLIDLITADTGSRVFNESLPEFITAEPSNELYKSATTQGAVYSASLTADAYDPDPDKLIFSKLNGPDWLSISTNGILSGIPDGDQIGTNTFTVRVADGRGGIDDITMYIVVNNAPPIIEQGVSVLVVMDEDGQPTGWIAPALAASDNGGAMTWSLLLQATNGAAEASGTGTSPTTLDYVPNANYSGTDAFSVQVEDDYGATDSIIVNVSINPDDLPDDWENQYGVTGSVDDNDEDTFSNQDEWIAGSDPTNGASFFQIADYADGAITVPGTAARTYVLSFSTNLNEAFVPILTNYTGAGFSGAVSLTDSVHNAESQGFYKVDVNAP